jgi:hypothetical protein
MQRVTLGRFCLAIVLAAAIGCSPGANVVSGTVNLDGQPLKEGLIRFVPVDGTSQPASTPVTDGKYSVPVSTGEMRVEISANRVIGKRKMYDTPDSPTVDEVEELVPPRFNVQSQLKIVVKGGSQTENFEVQSK